MLFISGIGPFARGGVGVVYLGDFLLVLVLKLASARSCSDGRIASFGVLLGGVSRRFGLST